MLSASKIVRLATKSINIEWTIKPLWLSCLPDRSYWHLYGTKIIHDVSVFYTFQSWGLQQIQQQVVSETKFCFPRVGVCESHPAYGPQLDQCFFFLFFWFPSLRIIFTFFYGWKNSKEGWYFVTGRSMWNSYLRTHIRERDCMRHEAENTYHLILSRKSLMTLSWRIRWLLGTLQTMLSEDMKRSCGNLSVPLCILDNFANKGEQM